jgi:hypothetical protein
LIQSPEYKALNSDGNVLEVSLATSKGSPESHMSLSEREMLVLDNAYLMDGLDHFLRQSCPPRSPCDTAETSLPSIALLCRAYLTLICPCKVKEDAGSFSNGIRLFSFALARIHELLCEVVNGFNREARQGDERYWSEAAWSLAILYHSLQHVQEGLTTNTLRPICVSYLPFHEAYYFEKLTCIGWW